MTQRLQLRVHPEFNRSYGGGIIRYFDKTPSDIVCPHFWELNWAYGCRFDCAYCYLQGTFHGKKEPWPRPLDQVLTVLDEFFKDHEKDPQILNSGELTDSLVFPNRINQISDRFEEQNRHKLLLLTKSSNVKPLVDRPRKQTIFSFSLNAHEVWRRLEHKTPSPEDRIKAIMTAIESEGQVRVRIDPIFPIEDWQKQYGDLVYLLLSELPNDPDRITLGTPRGLAKTRMFSKDSSWWKLAFENNPSEDSGWGKKIALPLRKEIYLFFYDKLTKLGFDKSRIAMCKETRSMWEELGLDYTKCKCNCVW
jgi:spore photoproduct lyase